MEEHIKKYRTWRALGNAFYLFVCIFLIGCIWQLLEMHLYGRIQHRKVDDIINLLYVYAIYCAYRKGVKDGMVDMEIALYKHQTNIHKGSDRK